MWDGPEGWGGVGGGGGGGGGVGGGSVGGGCQGSSSGYLILCNYQMLFKDPAA